MKTLIVGWNVNADKRFNDQQEITFEDLSTVEDALVSIIDNFNVQFGNKEQLAILMDYYEDAVEEPKRMGCYLHRKTVEMADRGQLNKMVAHHMRLQLEGKL